MFKYPIRAFFLVFCFTACAGPVGKDSFFTPSANPSPSPSSPISSVRANPNKDIQASPSPTATAVPPLLRIQQSLPETDSNGKISDIQITFTTSDNQVKMLRSISLNELASGFPIQGSELTSGVGYQTSLTITRLKASCTHITVFKGTGKWTPPKEAQTQTLAFPDKTSNQACENEADGTELTPTEQPSNPTSVAFNAENDALIRQKIDALFLAINQQNNDEILKFIQIRTPFYLASLSYGPFYFQFYNSMEYKDLEIKHYPNEIRALFQRVVNAPLIENRQVLALFESSIIFKFKQVGKELYLFSASQTKGGSLSTMRSPAAFSGGSGFEKVRALPN